MQELNLMTGPSSLRAACRIRIIQNVNLLSLLFAQAGLKYRYIETHVLGCIGLERQESHYLHEICPPVRFQARRAAYPLMLTDIPGILTTLRLMEAYRPVGTVLPIPRHVFRRIN